MSAPPELPTAPSSQFETLLRLRSMSSGSIEYHVAAGTLPQGPVSVAALADWPTLVQENIWADSEFGPVLRNRVQHLLRSGVVVSSSCSGKQSPEVSMKMMELAMRKQGMVLPRNCFVPWSSCDISPVCCRAISESSTSTVHLFSGMLGMFPAEVQEEVQALRAQAELS